MSEQHAAAGAGARLAAARKARGLSLASLAAQLKVSEARLAALEAERWSELPDGPYARGLATSFCRALGLDPKDVLHLMPGAAPVALEKVAEGINRPLQLHPRQRLQASGPLLLLLMLLLAVAAAVAFWPQGRSLPWSFSAQTAEADAEPVRMVEAPSVPLPVSVPASASAAAAPLPRPSSAVASAASAAAAVAAAASVPAAAAPPSSAPLPQAVPVVLAQGVGPAPATAAEAALLTVVAREETWVSISDARGASLVARVLTAGERLQLEAPAAPLRVVLGNAPGAELNWRGQSQDLAPFHAVRVARLTLN
ncbi:helix-turn-helix domain-containing protein [Inhella sp.]|uniref:helix-turn-helix domain-containing protein n=1 Tax=Inhella sp. TaxID=1921806 RepID=UPI0035AF979D